MARKGDFVYHGPPTDPVVSGSSRSVAVAFGPCCCQGAGAGYGALLACSQMAPGGSPWLMPGRNGPTYRVRPKGLCWTAVVTQGLPTVQSMTKGPRFKNLSDRQANPSVHWECNCPNSSRAGPRLYPRLAPLGGTWVALSGRGQAMSVASGAHEAPIRGVRKPSRPEANIPSPLETQFFGDLRQCLPRLRGADAGAFPASSSPSGRPSATLPLSATKPAWYEWTDARSTQLETIVPHASLRSAPTFRGAGPARRRKAYCFMGNTGYSSVSFKMRRSRYPLGTR